MPRSLRDQLGDIFPELAGATAPSDCRLSIKEAFTQFCKEMAGTEVSDKRGQIVKIEEHNFIKFLGMKRLDPKTGKLLLNQNGDAIRAKAKVTINAIKNGTFDPTSHFIDYSRLRTLFWIPDVLGNHDAIHENTSKTIEGDEVYRRKYNIQGACMKLVFTQQAGLKKVIVTSFQVEEKDLENYVKIPPIWPLKTNKPQ